MRLKRFRVRPGKATAVIVKAKSEAAIKRRLGDLAGMVNISEVK